MRARLALPFSSAEYAETCYFRGTGDIVKHNKGAKLITATTEEEKEDLWRARKVALWSALEYHPGSRCWTTDVCVPISKFPTLVAETQADLKSLDIVAPIVGHAGDGVGGFSFRMQGNALL